MENNYSQLLDTSGLLCPLPVLKARKALRLLRPGEALTIIATDPMAIIDIPHMCTTDGHNLTAQDTTQPPFRFSIIRGEHP